MNKRSYVRTDDGACETRATDARAVSEAAAAVPGRARLLAAADMFGALADPTRLVLLSALAAEELCVCDLVELAGVSQSAVSHQLRILRDLDLVTFERRGKRAVYRLADDHVRTLLAQGTEHAAERTGRS